MEITPVSGAGVKPYSQAVLNYQGYQDFKRRVQQQFPGVFTPREASLEVFAVTIGQERTIVARIPFEGGAGDSSFGVVFKGDSTVIAEARSALFLQAQDGNTRVLTEVDGTAEIEATIDPGGTFRGGKVTRKGKTVRLDGLAPIQAVARVEEVFAADAGLASDAVPAAAAVQAARRSRSRFWGCFAECLNRNGVGDRTIQLLGVCLAICTAPMIGQAVCIGCLVGVGAFNGAALGHCVRRCW